MINDIIATLLVTGIMVAVATLVLSGNQMHQQKKSTIPTMLFDSAAEGARPLVAHSYRLQGEPSQVVREAGSVAVIITRPGTAPPLATPSDAILLAGECVVSEEALGVTVNVGIFRYPDRDLRVPFTPALRALVLQRLEEVRASMAQGPKLTHQEAQVCRACAYRSMCAIGRINAPLPHSTMR